MMLCLFFIFTFWLSLVVFTSQVVGEEPRPLFGCWLVDEIEVVNIK